MSTSPQSRTRQPKGQPTGGEFVEEARPGSGLSLMAKQEGSDRQEQLGALQNVASRAALYGSPMDEFIGELDGELRGIDGQEYMVVYGLRNEGLTDQLGQVLAGLAQHGDVATATGTGFLVAGMSSVMNNMPTTLIAALGIDAAALSGLSEQMMVYASIIGADLGPKITPIGSLATLLWLSVLDRKGMHIGWGTYFRVGVVLTVPVLIITLLALAGWLTILGV